ncbi:hypothetical protein AB0756_15290 [Tolypothrix campylonemoides VB511288_2]|uniref:Uncharacterized protein n=2 Tax=Nostocales TaxID=1161 RepID=A0ABW8WSS7_9CYAN|nr:hypothetical protein [Tolypothrix bouteillei]
MSSPVLVRKFIRFDASFHANSDSAPTSENLRDRIQYGATPKTI